MATPWSLDDAVLSRFPKRIYIPLPDKKACQDIIKIQTKGLDISQVDLDKIGEQCVTRNYSGRDLQNVCRDAMKSMTRRINKDIFDNIENMAELSFEELQKKTLKGYYNDFQAEYKAEPDTFGGHAWDRGGYIRSYRD